jgi:hypothetical protein
MCELREGGIRGARVVWEAIVGAVERALLPEHRPIGEQVGEAHWLVTISKGSRLLVHRIRTNKAMASVTELLSIGMPLPRVLNPIAPLLQPSRELPLEAIAVLLDDAISRCGGRPHGRSWFGCGMHFVPLCTGAVSVCSH